MPDLKQDHPPLYRRVRKKFIVHVLIGLSLIFASPTYTPNAQGSIMEVLASLHVHGMIFLLIGLMIGLGLYYKKHTYEVTRLGMSIATGYSTMWLLSLLFNLTRQPGSLAVIILWAYWVSNLFEITTDPSWNTIEIVREVKDHDKPK